MNIAETAVSRVAAQARPDSGSAPKAKPQSSGKPQVEQAPPPNMKPAVSKSSSSESSSSESSKGTGEAVRFTPTKTDVVERQNAPKPKADAGSNVPTGNLSRDIGRDYSVDHGQVVVKVIDKENDEVIREIPPEELRRIKQAISELNRNSVVSGEKAEARREDQQDSGEKEKSEPGHGIDVTT